MRYELTDYEWAAVRPFLPNKPRGVPRVMPGRKCRNPYRTGQKLHQVRGRHDEDQ